MPPTSSNARFSVATCFQIHKRPSHSYTSDIRAHTSLTLSTFMQLSHSHTHSLSHMPDLLTRCLCLLHTPFPTGPCTGQQCRLPSLLRRLQPAQCHPCPGPCNTCTRADRGSQPGGTAHLPAPHTGYCGALVSLCCPGGHASVHATE